MSPQARSLTRSDLTASRALNSPGRKTEVIQKQLGSAGQVIAQRIKDRLESVGINRGQAEALAKAIEQETDAERLVPARRDGRRRKSPVTSAS